MQTTNITVIDSLMGSGKSSWAIQYMDAHPEESFIYCTPFLDEIERIKQSCNRQFYDPKKINGRKIEGFNYLLMSGRDIALTHSAFSNANDDTLYHLQNGNYVLILDEVLDILVDFNDIAVREVTKGDIRLLLNEGFIKFDEYGQVQWVKESYPDSKYSDVERLAKQGHLFYLDKSLLVWQFPPEIFRSFKKIYILTYLFQGSFLKPYFEYHGFDYELASVLKDENGDYTITEYNDYSAEKKKLKSLITINQHERLNDYKNASLSKNWFIRAESHSLKKLQNNLRNYFHHIVKAPSSDILWTCPKAFHRNLKGSGYNIVRRLTTQERELPKEEVAELEKKLTCYIPCNARATNVYRDRSTLAYVMNMYCNPYVKRYFTNKNQQDKTNISVDEDYLALSCLLQWVWRSQIRDGKPINIYIPSTRMRQLMTDWLDGKM